MKDWKFAIAIGCVLFAAACAGDDSSDASENEQDCNGGKCDIIGDDDRRDEFEGDVNDTLRGFARSTAMVIDNSNLINDGDRTTVVSQRLGDAYFMCPDETFSDQPIAGFCSAWLVAPDVMVTNGHCITSQATCEGSSFVFDYALTEEGQDISTVPSDNVYSCSQVLAWDYTLDCEVDFAVVKLDRKVEGREPLDVRGSDEELDSENLVIIGHPYGLPRKYALVGKLVNEGTNAFSTDHDIIGGNSGSSIIDAETGQVQGLVTCGGSNFNWEFVDDGWELETKTGQPCDMSCDSEGLFPDGSWDVCDDNNERRRCVCDDNQLVWEKRPCLAFEGETEGQCTREARYEQRTCEEAPWLCPQPQMQHTAHFAQYIGEWETFENRDLVEIPMNGEVESTITVDAEGVAQAFSVYLDFEGDFEQDLGFVSADLTIILEHNGEEHTLIADGLAQNGTAFDVANAPSGNAPVQVPFLLHSEQLMEVKGDWTLKIRNLEFGDYQMEGWRIQTLLKPTADDVDELGLFPCTEGCVSPQVPGPDPVVENFEGDKVDVETDLIEGTIAEGWEVEIIDEAGEGYEVIKTRRSQTMSMTKGEFGIVKDFGEELGGRVLTVDYRYDGVGWFQIWADDHILIAQQGFAQSIDSVTIPMGATSIRFVLGAVDDSQFHEATIFSMELTAGVAVEPTSCNGVLNCANQCGTDQSCVDACYTEGSADARAQYDVLVQCLNDFCGNFADDAEFNECAQTTCGESLNSCLAN